MFWTLLGRALRRRCPWCAERDVFVNRLRIRERCPRCGFRFDREEGTWLIAITINYGVTGVIWIAGLVLTMALTLPDPPVGWMLVGSVVQIVVTAFAFFPYSKTLSACLDVAVHLSQGALPGDMTQRFGVESRTPL